MEKSNSESGCMGNFTPSNASVSSRPYKALFRSDLNFFGETCRSIFSAESGDDSISDAARLSSVGTGEQAKKQTERNTRREK